MKPTEQAQAKAALFNRVSECNTNAMAILFTLEATNQYPLIIALDKSGIRGQEVCDVYNAAGGNPKMIHHAIESRTLAAR